MLREIRSFSFTTVALVLLLTALFEASAFTSAEAAGGRCDPSVNTCP